MFDGDWGMLVFAESCALLVSSGMGHLDPVIIPMLGCMWCIVPCLEACQPGLDCLAWDLFFMSTNKPNKEDVRGRHVVGFRYTFIVTELGKSKKACTIRDFCSRCMSTLDCFKGCLSSISWYSVKDFLFKSERVWGRPAMELIWCSNKWAKGVGDDLMACLRFLRYFWLRWGDAWGRYQWRMWALGGVFRFLLRW